MRSLAAGAIVLGISFSGLSAACAKNTDDLLKDVETVLGDAPKSQPRSAPSVASTDASHSVNTKADVSGAAAVSVSAVPSASVRPAAPANTAAAGSVAPVGFLATQQAGAAQAPNGLSASGPAPLGGFPQLKFSQQQTPGLGGVPSNPFAGQMQPQPTSGIRSMSPRMPQYFGGMMPSQPFHDMRFSASAYRGNMGGVMPSQRMMPMQNIPQQQRMQQPALAQPTAAAPQTGVGLGGRKPWAPTNSAHSIGGVPPPTSLLERVAASSRTEHGEQQHRAASRIGKSHHSAYKSVRNVANRDNWSVDSFHTRSRNMPAAVREASGLPAHLLDAGEEYEASLSKASSAPNALSLVEEKVMKDGDIASFVETSKAGDGRSEVAVRQGNGMQVSKREQAQLHAQQLAEQKAQAEALISASIYDYGSHRVGEPGSADSNQVSHNDDNPEAVQMPPQYARKPSWKYDKSSQIAAADTWLEKQREHSLLEQSRDEVDDPVGAGVPATGLQLDNADGNFEMQQLQSGTSRFKEAGSRMEKQENSLPGVSAFYAAHGAYTTPSIDEHVEKKRGLRGETNQHEIMIAHKKAVSELHDALARLRQDVGENPTLGAPRFLSKPLSNEVLNAEEEIAAQSGDSGVIRSSQRNFEPASSQLKSSESVGSHSSNIVEPAFDNKKPLAQEVHREETRGKKRFHHGDSRTRAVEKPAFSNKQPLSAKDQTDSTGANSLRFQSETSQADIKAAAMHERAMKNKNSFPNPEKLHWHGWVSNRKKRVHDRILEAMKGQLGE